MTDTQTDTSTASATLTVMINGVSETFTVASETTGDAGHAARALIHEVRDAATQWTYRNSRETR